MRRYSVLLAAALGALTLLFTVGAAQAAPPTFHIDLYAGNGAGGPGDPEAPDGTPATEGVIYPTSVAVAPDGTVYFASSGSVRYVDANGDLQTLAAGIGATQVAVGSDGAVFSDAAHDDSCPGSATPRIVKIVDGIVSNVVCQLGADSADEVYSLAVAQDGTVYYGEILSVWEVSPGGTQTLIAGTPFYGGSSIADPYGLTPYGGGVLVADTGWDQVRLVAGGKMTNFAGNGDYHYTGDGGSAKDAGLPFPRSVAVLADGSVLIGGYTWVRHVGTDGIINRVAGVVGQSDYSGDGGAALDAHMAEVRALAPDGSHVYVLDKTHYRIRVLDRDSSPPDTVLTAHPPRYSNVASATFEFTSTQDASTFRCKLDGTAWTLCESAQSYDGLAEGSTSSASVRRTRSARPIRRRRSSRGRSI
jgi:hypothetical protein